MGLSQLPLLLGYACDGSLRMESNHHGRAYETRLLQGTQRLRRETITPRRPRRDSLSNWTQSGESRCSRSEAARNSEPARRIAPFLTVPSFSFSVARPLAGAVRLPGIEPGSRTWQLAFCH